MYLLSFDEHPRERFVDTETYIEIFNQFIKICEILALAKTYKDIYTTPFDEKYKISSKTSIILIIHFFESLLAASDDLTYVECIRPNNLRNVLGETDFFLLLPDNISINMLADFIKKLS